MELRRWAQLVACVVLTYATLGVARGLVDALRERNLLRITVTLLFLVAGAAIAVSVLRRRPTGRQIAVLLIAASVYGFFLPRLEQIEERLHFLQYGLIGALAYSALDYRWVQTGRRSRTSAAGAALLLVLATGWLDEGIQYILPNRYYDIRDVLFNLAAGALAIVLTMSLGGRSPSRIVTSTET